MYIRGVALALGQLFATEGPGGGGGGLLGFTIHASAIIASRPINPTQTESLYMYFQPWISKPVTVTVTPTNYAIATLTLTLTSNAIASMIITQYLGRLKSISAPLISLGEWDVSNT